MTRTAAASVALAILALLVTGCSGPGEPGPTPTRASPTASTSPTPSTPTQGPTYVALGDSYTAGGLIGSFQTDGERCQRSAQNYPSIVSTTLDLPVTDVSCGGATTASVLEGDRGLPAQIEAITPRTRVVTVSIGGNDFGLYGKLILTCSRLSVPGASGAPCREGLASEVDALVPAIGDQVGATLDALRREAPDATVLLVGYPRLMPNGGTCPNTPYARGDVAWISSLESALSSAMATAARSRAVPFVPMYKPSKGHDLCSGDAAWVNGLDPPKGDGVVLHPNAAGERAIAKAVVKALRKTPGI
ncbi:MAG: SGNH/GDSL hydrolase family protein [Aeromicrobium sp.]